MKTYLYKGSLTTLSFGEKHKDIVLVNGHYYSLSEDNETVQSYVRRKLLAEIPAKTAGEKENKKTSKGEK